ncbi:hypothetical protein [Prosthecobacter sp.]|uniref:hypothetical protein n=1 Tax=Prosthecobacter sp. TaxID=1965333 RepID=UPI00378488DC
MRGQRYIQGGRKKVRGVLYMAVVRSVSINPILNTFDQGLLKRGKPFKVAITAVMRKMLCVLNRLIADPNFQPCQLTRLLSVDQRSANTLSMRHTFSGMLGAVLNHSITREPA